MLGILDAIALVEAARDRVIRILGVDGFRITSNRTQPFLEHSVDFSSESQRVDTWARVIDSIRRQPGDLCFEVCP
jgi:hypothetical protein